MLIIQPDKSMTVCFNKNMVLLLDSYKYYNGGGIITYAPNDKLNDSVNYLETMAQKS